MDTISSTIMFYGLTPDQEDFIMRRVPKCEFKIAGCGTDLIAIPADLLIVNPNELSMGEQQSLVSFYREIEPSEVSLILTDECDVFSGIKKIFVEKNLFIDKTQTELLLLRNLHQTKKDYDFSRRLADVMRLQRDIIMHAGITTKELAGLEEISERTIRRNIDTLNMAGAIIKHRKIENGTHANAKGWFSELAVWEVL